MNFQQRKDWVDFGKGLLMIFVYVYHSEVIIGGEHTFSWWFAPFFLTGFFFLSGYLYTSNIQFVNFKVKLKQIFRTILVPYVIFMMLMLVPKVILLDIDAKQQIIDVLMFKGSWFVVVIGVLQIIYTCLIRIKADFLFLSLATIILFILGYFIQANYDDLLSLMGNNIYIQSQELPNRFPFCLNICMMMSPFFLFGIIYRHFERRIRIPYTWKLIGGLLVGYIGLMSLDRCFFDSHIVVVTNSYKNLLLILIYALVGIFTLILISKKVGTIRLVNYIGRYSLLFYYLNAFVLRVVKIVLLRLHIDVESIWIVVIGAFIAIILTFPIVMFINRYLPVLSGQKDAFNKISKALNLNIQW